MPDHNRGMSNEHRRKNFTPADDVLIRQQPVTGIGLKRLVAILRTNQAALRERATELGVSLLISAEGDGALDTRTIRSSSGFVDPLPIAARPNPDRAPVLYRS
jgi:hypothetical protein